MCAALMHGFLLILVSLMLTKHAEWLMCHLSWVLAWLWSCQKTPHALAAWLCAASFVMIMCAKSTWINSCGRRGNLQLVSCITLRCSTVSHHSPLGVLCLQARYFFPIVLHATDLCIEITSRIFNNLSQTDHLHLGQTVWAWVVQSQKFLVPWGPAHSECLVAWLLMDPVKSLPSPSLVTL